MQFFPFPANSQPHPAALRKMEFLLRWNYLQPVPGNSHLMFELGNWLNKHSHTLSPSLYLIKIKSYFVLKILNIRIFQNTSPTNVEIKKNKEWWISKKPHFLSKTRNVIHSILKLQKSHPSLSPLTFTPQKKPKQNIHLLLCTKSKFTFLYRKSS